MRTLELKANKRGLNERTRSERLSERFQFVAVLTVALVQGILFVWLVPPWQHYDEPTHFEYAWLIANRGRLPEQSDIDIPLRRELQISAQASGLFESPLSISDETPAWIGWSELGHPPGYYVLAAVPLFLSRHFDLVTQLYAARLVSVALFVLTVAATYGIMCDLAPPRHPLRLAVPLTVALLPTFADTMTAVSNDVAAVLVVTLFVWGVVRLLARVTWRRVLWVLAAAAASVATKNTAMITIALLPLAGLAVLWRARRWRWRWLLCVAGGVGAGVCLAFLGWGDPAYWYRSGSWLRQSSGIQRCGQGAWHGDCAFMLEAEAGAGQRQIRAPLLRHDVEILSGRTVTIGAWIWADRQGTAFLPGLAYRDAGATTFETTSASVAVTTTPTFQSTVVAVPTGADRAQLVLSVESLDGAGPTRVFYDGLVVVAGEYPPDTPPQLDSNGNGGAWAATRFRNLVRNGSAEQAWPRPRAGVERRTLDYTRLSPAQSLQALLDVQRIWPFLATWSTPLALDGLIERYGWGQIRLTSRWWTAGLYGVLITAGLGAIMWARRMRTSYDRRSAACFVLFALAAAAWTITILRPLPVLDPTLVVPSARYAYPAIVPTVLLVLGGWWSFWPHRLREVALAGLVLVVLVLNVVSMVTIQTFFA